MRTLRTIRSVVIPTLCVLLLPNFAKASNTAAVLVLADGDDGLTLRLEDAIESKFKHDPSVVISDQLEAGTIVVTIPRNVNWKKVGGRMRALYSVEYSVGEHKIGAKSGSCWDDQLEECAAQIAAKATKIMRKAP